MSQLRDATGAPITTGKTLFDETGKPVISEGGSDATAVDLNVSTVSIVNTTSETTIYSYTIPGGTTNFSTLYSVEGHLSIFNNTGGNVGVRWRCYWDGVAKIDFSTGDIYGSAATPRNFYVVFHTKIHPSIPNVGLAFVHDQTPISATGTINAGTGQGIGTLSRLHLVSGFFTPASLGSDRTIKITAQLSTNSVNFYVNTELMNVLRWRTGHFGT